MVIRFKRKPKGYVSPAIDLLSEVWVHKALECNSREQAIALLEEVWEEGHSAGRGNQLLLLNDRYGLMPPNEVAELFEKNPFYCMHRNDER